MGYVALATIDKATLALSFVPRRKAGIHEVTGLILEVLAGAGNPHHADYAARRTGKRLLRGDNGRIEVVPWDRGGFGILATPDPEYLVPSPAATLQDQRGNLMVVGSALVAEGLADGTLEVTLSSITPLVDVAACPLRLEDLSALPGLTSRVADRHIDENGNFTSLLGFGLRQYNKTHQVQNTPTDAYVLKLYENAGVLPEHHPIWRTEAPLGARTLAGSSWPPDLGALHRSAVIRFLRLGTGRQLRDPVLDTLLAARPWSVILTARFPPVDIPAGRPTTACWTVEEQHRHALGLAPYVTAELLARRGLQAASLADGFRQLAESPQLADPRLEAAFQNKLRVARARYASGDGLPPSTPKA